MRRYVSSARGWRAAITMLACALSASVAVSAAHAAGRSSVVGLAPNDEFYSELAWPANSINLPRAWTLGLGRPSVTIAILDTGVTPVRDLAGALVPGYDF